MDTVAKVFESSSANYLPKFGQFVKSSANLNKSSPKWFFVIMFYIILWKTHLWLDIGGGQGFLSTHLYTQNCGLLREELFLCPLVLQKHAAGDIFL